MHTTAIVTAWVSRTSTRAASKALAMVLALMGLGLVIGSGQTAAAQPPHVKEDVGSGEKTNAPSGPLNASGAFVVIGDHGAKLSSSDGVSWTSLTSMAPANVAPVARGGGLLVRVGTGPTLQTS